MELTKKQLAGSWRVKDKAYLMSDCKVGDFMWYFTEDGKCGLSIPPMKFIGTYDIDPCYNRLYVYFPHDTLFFDVEKRQPWSNKLTLIEHVNLNIPKEESLTIRNFLIKYFGKHYWYLQKYKSSKK